MLLVILVPRIGKPGGVNNGQAAVVTTAAFAVNGHLVFTRSDGRQIDAGPMPAVSWIIPTGTPTASTPGVNGQQMIDANYLYTFFNGSWSKSIRANL